MNHILKFKHWQLFLLSATLPVILNIYVNTQIGHHGFVAMLMKLFCIVMFFTCGVALWWAYTVGTNLYKRQPTGGGLKINRFLGALLIPAVYIAFLLFLIMWLTSSVHHLAQPPVFVILLAVVIHLFSMVCIFYCIAFIAKALNVVEGKRANNFSDYAGDFFLLWFFFIGIWIIQPRINRIFAHEPDAAIE